MAICRYVIRMTCNIYVYTGKLVVQKRACDSHAVLVISAPTPALPFFIYSEECEYNYSCNQGPQAVCCIHE